MKIWTCKIGEVPDLDLPAGSDFPMREAIREAYVRLTGREPDFIFSGWGGELDDLERQVATASSRKPDPHARVTVLRHDGSLFCEFEMTMDNFLYKFGGGGTYTFENINEAGVVERLTGVRIDSVGASPQLKEQAK